MHLSPFLHQVAGQAQGHVVGIFIFVQFSLSDTSHCPWVGSSMSADHIEAGSLQAVSCDFHLSKFLAKKRFAEDSPNAFSLSGFRLFSVFFPQRRDPVFHAQTQLFLPAQLLPV